MSTKQTITCDFCGQVKGETNHWYKLHAAPADLDEGPMLVISHDGDGQDACGEKCVQIAVARWLEKATLALLLLILGLAAPARAQSLPDAPQARLASPIEFWALSAADLAVTLVDTVETADRHRAGAWEANPFERPFVGLPKPAFVTLAAADSVGLAYLAYRMRRSPREWERRMWWVPQSVQLSAGAAGIAFSASHPSSSPSKPFRFRRR